MYGTNNRCKAYTILTHIETKHVWTYCRYSERNGFIQISEHRQGQVVFLLCLTILVPCGLGWTYYRQYGYFDTVPAAICLFIAIFLATMSLRYFQLPRAIRLYPKEKLAQSSCLFLFLRVQRRWHDLAATPLVFVEIAFESDEEQPQSNDEEPASSGGGLISLLVGYFDPIGPLVGFWKLAKQPKPIVTGAGLRLSEPSGELLAAFQDKTLALRLIESTSG